MIEVLLNNRWYKCPTKWNDLTGKQLIAITRVFEAPGAIDEVRLKLLKILTRISTWRFWFADVDELNQVLYLSDFLIKQNGLSKNILPKYKGFAGPADDFENLLMSEFVYTEGFFFKWKEDEGNTDPLNQLVAVLYRKEKQGYDAAKNIDGDVRAPFNEYECKYYARRKIAKWPLMVKKAIAFWYQGCREKMISDFSEVFTGGGDPAKYGMLETMMDVAKEGVHGNFKDVERMPVRLVMVSIDKAIREADKLKASMA